MQRLYDIFGIGEHVRTPEVLIENVNNAFRRSRCLSLIEAEFTEVVSDNEDGDEPQETCLLNWGADPEDYIQTFRNLLTAKAQHGNQ
jgi:hypothetical protein